MSMTTVKTGKILPPKGTTAVNAMSAFTEIVGAVSELVKVHDQETTKRSFIRANEHVLVTEIRAKSQLFLAYLDRSFDEREQAFQRLFNALDVAMSSNLADVASILGSITTLAARSPFADLANFDLVKANLDDPNHEWTA